MKNQIKPFLDDLGITPYRFWHDTGISRVTAYKLYNDPTYIPGADVLVKICDTYQIQPGAVLIWYSEKEGDTFNAPKDSDVQDFSDLENHSSSVEAQSSQHESRICRFENLFRSA